MDLISEDTVLAVKKGSTWLDEFHPGWAEKIDLDRLDMNNCTSCVIGQAVCNYFDLYTTNTHLNWDYPTIEEWAMENGFQAPDEIEDNYEYFHNLETLWTDEVWKRLG